MRTHDDKNAKSHKLSVINNCDRPLDGGHFIVANASSLFYEIFLACFLCYLAQTTCDVSHNYLSSNLPRNLLFIILVLLFSFTLLGFCSEASMPSFVDEPSTTGF